MAKKKKHFIQNAIQHEGALSRKAAAAGETVAQYAANPPANITAQTKRQIAFYENVLKPANRKRKNS